MRRRHGLRTFFDRVFVLNLARRRKRLDDFWQNMPRDWPFRYPQPYLAIDGFRAPPPRWYHGNEGIWGCYRSHLRILEECLNENVNSVLIFEDDARFCSDFTSRVTKFIAATPRDWDMIYLGGEHYWAASDPPRRVNAEVFSAYNINRSHAYAIRGAEFMRILYRYLQEPSHLCHIDQRLGMLHETQTHHVFCPAQWLVGQAAGESDTGSGLQSEHFWPSAHELSIRPDGTQFVVVLGIHHSGSALAAKLLYDIGVHLGDRFTADFRDDPAVTCGYEAVGLAHILQKITPFPTTTFRLPPQQIIRSLYGWIDQRRRNAQRRCTVAGGHSPVLSRLGQVFLDALRDDLRVINVNRSVEHCTAALIRDFPEADPKSLAEYQRWLLEGKQQFVDSLPSNIVFNTNHEELSTASSTVTDRIISFLGPPTTPRQAAQCFAK